MQDAIPPADGAPKPRRRLKACHLLLLALALLVGGHLLWLAMLSNALDAELQEIRDAGYPATPEEANAAYEPVPRDENAALVLQRALDAIQLPGRESNMMFDPEQPRPDESTGKQLRKHLPLIGEAVLPDPGETLPGEMRAAIQEVLANNEKARRLLHEGAAMERARWPIDLTQGIETLLPHTSRLREGAKLLALEGIDRLAKGQSEAAAASAETILGLSRSLRTEPIVVSLMTRRDIQNHCLGLLERLLARGEMPDKLLRHFQHRFAAAETPDAMPRAVASDGAGAGGAFEKPLGKIEELVGMMAGSPSRSGWPLDGVKLRVWNYSGLLMLDQLTYLELTGEMIRTAEKPLPQRPASIRKVEKKTRHLPFYAELTHRLVPALSRAAAIDAHGIAQLRTARAALAAERYRLAEGRWPEDLEALTPRHIPAVPLDPFTGDPLKFKKDGTGFTVYSVNKDQADDGGAEPAEDEDERIPGTDIPFTVRR